jgi:hypothetical protein
MQPTGVDIHILVFSLSTVQTQNTIGVTFYVIPLFILNLLKKDPNP